MLPLQTKQSINYSTTWISVAGRRGRGGKSIGQIPVELFNSGGRKICCKIRKLIISVWKKEELPEE
jgi:hypothetical protein